ncbi:MAG: sulfite exporter TauE/SafE family protein [Dehalococcoidia bacterium]|nr:sulfite exporter TauE/SafE family protein [Dehalococcoidia bacterium]
MQVTLFTPLLAFAAGLLSCLSPCVVPLLPAYIGNLSGVAAGTPGERPRRVVFSHAVAFVVGFTLVFVVLGASVGLVGYAVRDQQDVLRKIGGIFMIVMGLQIAEIIRIPVLSRTFQPVGASAGVTGQRVGYARSVGLGSAMAIGWTPCIGPTLGGILTLAATSGSTAQASGLLLAYSAGLAVPFLAAGLFVGQISRWSRRLQPMMPAITLLSGVILIIAGMLVYTNALAQFNSYFSASGIGTSI